MGICHSNKYEYDIKNDIKKEKDMDKKDTEDIYIKVIDKITSTNMDSNIKPLKPSPPLYNRTIKINNSFSPQKSPSISPRSSISSLTSRSSISSSSLSSPRQGTRIKDKIPETLKMQIELYNLINQWKKSSFANTDDIDYVENVAKPIFDIINKNKEIISTYNHNIVKPYRHTYPKSNYDSISINDISLELNKNKEITKIYENEDNLKQESKENSNHKEDISIHEDTSSHPVIYENNLWKDIQKIKT